MGVTAEEEREWFARAKRLDDQNSGYFAIACALLEVAEAITKLSEQSDTGVSVAISEAGRYIGNKLDTLSDVLDKGG